MAISFGKDVSESAAVAIILQSTVGGFSDEFMRKLPQVERAMIAHGLDPAQFVISKDRAAPSIPFVGPFFHEYTVFVGDESFAVTEPNDMVFLDFFLKRCIAEHEVPRAPGPITRFLRWMSRPI